VEKSSVAVCDMSDIEDRIRTIEGDVKKIMTNDLPHMSATLASLAANQKWLIALCVGILSAIIAGLVQTFLK